MGREQTGFPDGDEGRGDFGAAGRVRVRRLHSGLRAVRGVRLQNAHQNGGRPENTADAENDKHPADVYGTQREGVRVLP